MADIIKLDKKVRFRYLVYKRYTLNSKTNRLKGKEWEKINHADGTIRELKWLY